MTHRQSERDVHGHGVQVAFDNNPHTATVGIITGVNGETGATVGTINLSGTTHTLPSDYPSDPWTFTGTANYNNQNGTVHESSTTAPPALGRIRAALSCRQSMLTAAASTSVRRAAPSR